MTGSRSIGVLCARGASKRLPRKHTRPIAGLPLVGWMCRAAAASGLDRVVLTTEDAEIAAIGRENGADVPFMREAPLAADYASDYDIVVDALDRTEAIDGLSYDIVVMLQPTTPFTSPEDINGCLAALRSDVELGCCFTVRKVSEPPSWMFSRTDDGRAMPFIDGIGANEVAHKQLLSDLFVPNGAAYAMRADAFRKQRRIYAKPLAFHVMPAERSIDIDEAADLAFAEALASSRGFVPFPIEVEIPHSGDRTI